MPRGKAALATLGIVLALSASGVFLALRARTRQAPSAALPPDAEAAWCGKPLGSKAAGQLADPAKCTKLSLTGTAPACVFWADCGELHFELDCASGGPGQCRCDGEEGLAVRYSPSFCALDTAQPSRSLRVILDSASTACRWTPR